MNHSGKFLQENSKNEQNDNGCDPLNVEKIVDLKSSQNGYGGHKSGQNADEPKNS